MGLALLGLNRFDQAGRMLERALLLSERWRDQSIDLRKAFGGRWEPLRATLATWRKEEGNQQAGDFLVTLVARFDGQFEQAKAARTAFARRWPRAASRRLALDRLFVEDPRSGPPARDPGHRDPYVRGVYLFYNGRYDAAGDAFAEAYVQQPRFLLGRLFLGHAQFAVGKHRLAARVVLGAVRLDAEQVARKVGLLREFYKNPDLLDQQLTGLKKQLKASPWPEGFFLLAYLYYADGEYPASQALFEKLGKTLGTRQAGLKSLSEAMAGWCARQIRGELPRRIAGKPPQAPKPTPGSGTGGRERETGAKTGGAKQTEPDELLERCALHLKKGQYGQARQNIEQYFKAHKATDMAYFLRARVHLASGEYVFGGIAVRNGLALAGEVSRVRFDWTRFYPTSKAFTEHLTRLDRFVDAQPEKPNARFLAGFIHYYLGSYDRALKLFKRNLWLDPNDRHARMYIDLITRKLSKDGPK